MFCTLIINLELKFHVNNCYPYILELYIITKKNQVFVHYNKFDSIFRLFQIVYNYKSKSNIYTLLYIRLNF